MDLTEDICFADALELFTLLDTLFSCNNIIEASPPPQRLPNTSGGYHPHYFYHHCYYGYRYYFYHHHHISGPRAPSRRHWAQSSLTAYPGEVELYFLYMCTCVLLSFLAFGPHRGGARPAVAFCLLGRGRAVYNCTFSSFSSCARSRAPHGHSHQKRQYKKKKKKKKKNYKKKKHVHSPSGLA